MSSRVRVQDPPSSFSQKAPRRSSFLSLRRDQPACTEPYPASPTSRSPPAKSTSPSSFYAFRDDPAPLTSRVPDPPRTHGRRPSKTASLRHEQSFPTPKSSSRPWDTERDRNRNRDRDRGWDDRADDDDDELPEHVQSFLEFPSADPRAPRSPDESSNKLRSRARSGPSTHFTSLTSYGSSSYPVRDSNSSSLSHFEDPTPPTPVDDSLFFRDPAFGPVVVAAPVAGVETMDALVDGMNGFGGDDHFMGLGGMSASRPSKTLKVGFHPLYQPPLPKPPPGIKLGGALPRKHSARERERESLPHPLSAPRSRKANGRVAPQSTSPGPAATEFPRYPSPTGPPTAPKTVAPSISEIIRAHAPVEQQTRSRKTSYATSYGHDSVPSSSRTRLKSPTPEPEPAPLPETEDETDMVSRSSVDTLAEEIQRSMQAQKRAAIAPHLLHKARSQQMMGAHSAAEHGARGLGSPRPTTDARRESSIYSNSTTISDQPPLPPLDLMGLTRVPVNSPSQTIAQYLRSTRLTTLLRLTRSPHASRGSPLTVSLSDLGSKTGFPVLVFLGLGCVRHIMGLYDEMAECMGIRLITIDRWGLGRTEVPKSKSSKGIPEWASIVEEVLDQLEIDQCSIMAHSAGTPYAMAFANKHPERVRGELCLLAPWVAGGEGGGYKWLKYVPNGLLKTAQAAEWKVQAWMLGKPPTIAFEGIGFDIKSAHTSPPSSAASSSSALNTPRSPPHSAHSHSTVTPAKTSQSEREQEPRPSTSTTFSDYDDLRDFEGRFDSLSTIGQGGPGLSRNRTISEFKSSPGTPARKPSRGFLGRFKSNGQSNQQQQPTSPQGEKSSSGPTKRLKALRSMGSLKGRSRAGTKASDPPLPMTTWLPPAPERPEVGLGLDPFDWGEFNKSRSRSPSPLVLKPKDLAPLDTSEMSDMTTSPRASGRRSMSMVTASPASPSISLSSSLHPISTATSSAGSKTPTATPTPGSAQSFQVALGNALIAASHAESAKGTHNDLLQILNHDRLPLGFSYLTYPHDVRVWYGDHDEKIGENAVRWMEQTMGPDKCRVTVVKGAEHALVYRSGVVIEVLEQLTQFWRDWP
ncbi:uncharacterized protein BXZ73DRAFT_74021 [Epithele typhae]|uniref:uncharacterized protein n=1 Tax=Epithele typhae TaxID=378194 RepID=UPI002007ACBE|nr:uncharacterized protein BXZ73DRAFT_74021 [Epithele typhae]KAH9944528.1 hypothetical protein BXZ73DRAFT_74021 [Epithele typhae]